MEETRDKLDAERREIRARVDLFLQIQKLRIAESNRHGAYLRGVDDPGQGAKGEKVHAPVLTWLEEIEGKVERIIRRWVRTRGAVFPVLRELMRIRGVGEMFAAYLVCAIDIEKADTVSALWRFAGYAVVDGQAERPRKGEKLHYSRRLKVACWKIGSSFLRCQSPYAQIYHEAKAYYQANRPEWSKQRVHFAAMRKMMKVFLCHLWVVWRQLEGLPCGAPYVHEHMGHAHYLQPADFGWDSCWQMPMPERSQADTRE